jgi:predicted  nucleic acid-binding Zn-ribbon protein
MPEADQSSLRKLLDLQAEDSAITRLQERRAALPEAARLEGVRARLEELEADLAISAKQQEEVARERSRLEGEIGLLNQKSSKEEQRLLSGKVSNPKELGALQAEVAMLGKRRAGLEDELLEVMVQQDDHSATAANLEKERGEAAAEEAELAKTVAATIEDIDAEIEERERSRAAIATEIPDDLSALYEKIRAAKGGVGAAALEGGTCLGCHTKLPSVEVERIRNEGGLNRCDNCRRILVVL